MNPLIRLSDYGQSIWFDNISRAMLKSGELKELVEKGEIKGVTSNPSIFQKALKGDDYNDQLKDVFKNFIFFNKNDLYEKLVVADIKNGADVLRPVYEQTKGLDGYVSLEVSPELAYDTENTEKDARRLSKLVSRPNLMVKIPATDEGIPAIEEMIYEGININVTLIFSPLSYEKTAEAYIRGLERRLDEGKDISNISSVASFFISRIDTAVDKLLEEKGNKDLQGKAAIANAKLVFKRSLEIFNSERFLKLKNKGAKVQRLLWASTSTKNPDYPDVLYIEELIGPDTVNTVPPATIKAYRDHGKPETRINVNVEEAQAQMNQLKELGIDFLEVTRQLTDDGVALFQDSFRSLMDDISQKMYLRIQEQGIAQNQIVTDDFEYRLLANKLNEFDDNDFINRLYAKDYTLWKNEKKDDVELSNRLGWLELPTAILSKLDEIISFAEEAKKDYDNVVLLGMGGSSLAPEVFYMTFGNKEGYPSLKVLDNTHPETVRLIKENYDLNRTLFVAASKSGSTVETMSFFYEFWNDMPKEDKGFNFIALTDAGSGLEKLATEKKFRKIFLTPSEVGGRFSALTQFGLVPAALIGVDIRKVAEESYNFYSDTCYYLNSAPYVLGTFLGLKAKQGKNKLTFITSKSLKSLPDWIEQLVAESTGKEGEGIVPIVEKELRKNPKFYTKDRIFVHISLLDEIDPDVNAKMKKVQDAGFDVFTIILNNKYEIGAEFYKWEIATAVAGSILKINPFNQPNVQLAKSLANNAITEIKLKGKIEEKGGIKVGNLTVYGLKSPKYADNFFSDFLDSLKYFDFSALLAFMHPDPEIDAILYKLKETIENTYNVPVTYNFGPRYLHSTGQLHKGGENNGVFIIFTAGIKNDLEVPGQGYTFGQLITAQAIGDFNALKNTGRRVIRIHLKNPVKDIKQLIKAIKE